MRMSEDEKNDYIASVENLAMIKLFHDAGVNVKNFPEFQTAILHGVDESLYIFEIGVTRLFGDCTLLYIDDDKNDELFNRIKQLGNLKYLPEYACVIPIDTLEERYDSLEQAIAVCNANDPYEHGKLVWDKERNVLYIPLDYIGYLTDVSERIIQFYQEMNK
jgi:hypothetical protein